MADKIKLGIIGSSTMYGYGQLPLAVDHPDYEVYAIAEVNPDRLDFIAGQCKVPPERRFSDYHDLLQMPEIQGVVVTTRVDQHYGVVMSAALAGKHILCERPLAPTVAQGWEMVDAARQNNVMLLVNLPVRMEAPTRKLIQLVREGKVGKVCSLRLCYLWYGPEADRRSYRQVGSAADSLNYLWFGAEIDKQTGSQRSRRDILMEEGGGPIFDTGTHYFDLARVLAGSEFRDINAVGSWVETQYNNPGHVICTGYFENGVIALIEESWVYTHNSGRRNAVHRVEVVGTEGLAVNEWDWDPEKQIYTANKVKLFAGGQFQEDVYQVEKDFVAMYGHFANVVREGKYNPDMATGEDGIIAMECAMKALDACRRNRFAKNEILREQSKYWVT